VNHWLLLALVFGFIVPVTVGSAVVWVAFDAATRGVKWPGKWVSVLVITFPLFPLVLMYLRLRHDRVGTPGSKYFIARNIAVGSIFVPILAVAMSPPDVTVQIFNWAFALLLVLVGGYLYEWL
jgi:hypothetical protein